MDKEMMRAHWDHVYETKNPNQVSWTQEVPQISLDLIRLYASNKQTSIIDVGGGDSRLVDFLLDEGFENITVLDISEKSLEKAKARLGERAHLVKWIASDVLDLETNQKYDIWHDRAAFHFLKEDHLKQKYLKIAQDLVEGYLILGTFSTSGPLKCSGLEIQQYDQQTMRHFWKEKFDLIHGRTDDHKTPFGTLQNFLYCSFKKVS